VNVSPGTIRKSQSTFSGFGDALLAQITAPFAPRRTAWNNRHTGLGAAYLSHWFALLLWTDILFLYFSFVVYYIEQVLGNSTKWPSFGAMLVETLSYSWQELHRSTEIQLMLISGVLAVELGFVMLGLILLPWGANHEPAGVCVRRAFRTSWLNSTLLPLLVATCFTSVAVCEILRRTVFRGHELNGVLGLLRYPWYVLGWTACAGAVAALLILLRAVATKSDEELKPTPLMCERCGYNLSHTPDDSRCPECGEPAANSIGQTRRATEWEASRPAGWIRTYIRSGIAAVFRPSAFFKAMPTRTGRTRARAIGLLHMAHAGLWTLIVFGSLMVYDEGINPGRWYWTVKHNLIALTYIAFLVFALLTLATGVVASVTGLYVSWKYNRPLLAPVAKVFFYSNSVFVMWMAVGLTFLLVADRLCRQWFGGVFPMLRPGYSTDEQTELLLMAIVGLGLLAWLFVVRRGIRQVVYANT
jgi:hypothetical protein